MNKNKQDVFENYSVPKAVWTLALPMIIGMIVMVFYNLVDTFFVGQTGDANQVAAVSLAMPAFFILIGLGNLFGIGASSVISRYLGEKRYDKVSIASSFAFWGSIIVGSIAGLITIMNMDSIISIVGANADTEQFVSGYITYIAIGAPFIILSSSMGAVVRSEGNAKVAMIGMMIGTIINIVLDPLFIFTFNYGVVGAAIATVIANIISAIYFVIVILRNKETHISIGIKHCKIADPVVRSVLAIGIPASLTNLLMSFSNIVYNTTLANYGNDPVAAMGIVMKVSFMYVMIFIGLTQGVQPLIGYSFGAKNYDRMKKVLRYVTTTSIIVGAICYGVFFFSAEGIMKIFISDENVINYGIQMLRIQISSAPLIGIMFVAMSMMQATGHSIQALILSICRQGIVFIPAVYILDRIFGFDGIIWAQPVADGVSIILSLFVFVWFFRKTAKKDAEIEDVKIA